MKTYKRRIHHREHDEQTAFFNLMSILEAKGNVPAASTFAVPNGAHFSSVRHGQIMHAEGMKSGVPDILVAYANLGFHGMAIEMKIPPNRVTPKQKEWLDRLKANGWRVVVCISMEDAFNQWVEYVPSAPEVDDLVKQISWESL